MDLAKQPPPQEMELANQPPLQEILPRQTSWLCSTYAAIGDLSLPAQAVFGRLALASSCFFQLSSGRSRGQRQSGPEAREGAVVFSCLFQLAPAQGRQRREESSGRSPWLFLSRPTLS